MIARKPTERMTTFLRWCEQQGRFSTWSVKDDAIMQRARQLGWVERVGREPGMLGLAYFGLSEAGRAALRDGAARFEKQPSKRFV